MRKVKNFIDLDPMFHIPYTWDEISTTRGRFRGGSFYDFSEWTPKLREVANEYLANLPDNHFAVLLSELGCEVSGEDRKSQIALVTTATEPKYLALAAHYMAVRTAPTFEVLIDSLSARPSSRRRSYFDIGEWLDANTTLEQRFMFVHEIDSSFPLSPPEGDASSLYIVDWLQMMVDSQESFPSSYRLLQAWEAVTAQKSMTAKMPRTHVTTSTAAIRLWANEHDYKVGSRGRIPTETTKAYNEAHQTS